MKRITIAILAVLALVLALAGFGSSAGAADGTPGDSPDNPILVASPDDVPAGAVQTGESTGDDCSTTTTWTLTVPATDDTTHEEFRYGRFVQAVEEQSHQEWSVDKRTRTIETVKDYRTEYHFAKFTQTRTKAPASEEVWANFSPDRQQGPFTGPPAFPSDTRGTWHLHSNIPGGHAGPDGVYSTSDAQGRASWFYRKNAVESEWSAYGPWTKWSPESHTSWETSPTPLGAPAYHGSGTYADGTKWERQWQAQHDGTTRQVEIGSHEEIGDWSEWTTVSANLLTDPTPRVPENTRTVEYRVNGPVKVVDVEHVPGYREFFVLGGDPSRNIEDASWVLAEQAPGEGWIQFDQRTVSHEDGTPEVVTYYAFNDGVACEEPPVDEPPVEQPPAEQPPAAQPPAAPAVPVVIDAGL